MVSEINVTPSNMRQPVHKNNANFFGELLFLKLSYKKNIKQITAINIAPRFMPIII